MLRFRLFGITIHVQPFFWLTMAYIGGGFRLLNEPSKENFVYTLIFVVAGFISIVVHELGHAITMQKYGRTPQIVLHAFGGAAMSSGQQFTKKENIFVTLAGPFYQIILGILAWLIISLVGAENFPTTQSFLFVYHLFTVSMVWAILNLIPLYPLDGGNLFAALAGPLRRRLVHQVGIGIGIVLILLSLKMGSPYNIMILGLLTYENVKALQRH